jgi:hypothetical protein
MMAVPPDIQQIMGKARKHRSKAEQKKLDQYRSGGRGPAPGGQPQFALPNVQLPPFLLELMGGMNQEYEPTPDASLMMQAQQMASAQTAPGLAQIRSMLQGGSQAINQLTGSVQAAMRPVLGQVQGLYGAAANQTSAVNDAMATRLQSLGLADQSDLAGQFQAAGLTPSLPLAQGVGDTAAAASQASFATGSSALNRLAAEGAAAGSYAAGLPGIASLGGQAAIGALTRDANAAAAGLAAQGPGLQMDAYRSLRSSEDARRDAADSKKMALAEALMDWNQNIQNIALQTYITDLGFFGDREDAQRETAEFLASLGLSYDQLASSDAQFAAGLAQDESQFTRGLQADQAAAAAGAEEDVRSDRQRLVKDRNSYIESWTGKSLERAQELAKGYYRDQPEGGGGLGSTGGGGGGRQHRRYTREEARKMLTRFLSNPILHSDESRRYGLKQRLIDRLVREALASVGPNSWKPTPLPQESRGYPGYGD